MSKIEIQRLETVLKHKLFYNLHEFFPNTKYSISYSRDVRRERVFGEQVIIEYTLLVEEII